MKSLIAVTLMAIPLLAAAKDAKNPDHNFYENAAQAGIAEVEAGQLATQKGSSAAVKEFGAMMVKDHTAANNKLKTIATSKNIELPTEPSVAHKAKKKMLDMKSGANFDEAYIKGQVKDHEDTVALLKKEIAEGKDADAKAFASEILPKVEDHLMKVRKLEAGNAATADTKHQH